MNAAQLAKSLYTLVAEDPKQTKKIVTTFLAFVEEKKALGLLPQILRQFEALSEQATKKQTLHVTLSKTHGAEVLDSIAAYIKSGDAPVAVTIDEKIKGGFIATYNDIVYDASVETSLARARKSLLS